MTAIMTAISYYSDHTWTSLEPG